jgi:hypothetical protein
MILFESYLKKKDNDSKQENIYIYIYIITITWQKKFYQNINKKKKKTGHLLSCV